MYSSSTSNVNCNSFPSSPQPHKKRKISSEKTKSIHSLNSPSKPPYPLKNEKKRRLDNMKSSSLNNDYSSSNKCLLSMDNKCKNKNNDKYSKNNNKNKISLREEVEPWWIGQRIVVKIPDPNNLNTYIDREATIRDYYPYKKLSHIWFEAEDNNFEIVDLLKLEDWHIADNKPLYEQIEFVPNNDWIPIYWKMKQRVLVRFDGKFGNGLKFAAFIDGYDPISRRHHINYGNTTEWLWATKERVQIYNKKKCDHYIEEKMKKFEINRDEIEPPPWNPRPYGLDETFAIKSKQIEQNRLNQMKTVAPSKNMSNNNEYSRCDVSQTDHPNVKIFGNKTHPRRKIPNTTTNGARKRINPLMKKSTPSPYNNKTKKGKSLKLRMPNSFMKHSNVNGQNSAKKEEQKISHHDGLGANNNNAVTICSDSSSFSGSTFSTKTSRNMSRTDSDIMLQAKNGHILKAPVPIATSSNITIANNNHKSGTDVRWKQDVKKLLIIAKNMKNNQQKQNQPSVTKNIETDRRITMKPTNSNNDNNNHNNNHNNNPTQQQSIPFQQPIAIQPQPITIRQQANPIKYPQIPVTTLINTINPTNSITPVNTINGIHYINTINRVNEMNGGNEVSSCTPRNRINAVVQIPMVNQLPLQPANSMPSQIEIFAQPPLTNNTHNPIPTITIPSKSIMNMNNLPIVQPMNAKIILNRGETSKVIQTKISKMNTSTSTNASPTTLSSSSSIESKSMYPRTAIIGGSEWIRHFSHNYGRYYWLLTNDKNEILCKEWDPWREHGLKAPWMSSMQKWYKFIDATEKKTYFYNYDTRQSTFDRPNGYMSDPQIQYDSANNDNNN